MLRFGLKLTPAGLIGGASTSSGPGFSDRCHRSPPWEPSTGPGFWVNGSSRRACASSELLFPTLRGAPSGTMNRYRARAYRLVAVLAGVHAAVRVGRGRCRSRDHVRLRPGIRPGCPALVYLLLVPAVTTVTTVLSQALIAEGRALVTGVTNTVSRVTTHLARSSCSRAAWGSRARPSAWPSAPWHSSSGSSRSFSPEYPAVGKWWPRRQLVGQGAAYVVGFIAARATIELLPGYAGLAVSLLLGSLLYSAVALLVCGLLPRDRVRAHMVIDRVSQRLRQQRGFPAPAAPSPIPRRPIVPRRWHS